MASVSFICTTEEIAVLRFYHLKVSSEMRVSVKLTLVTLAASYIILFYAFLHITCYIVAFICIFVNIDLF